VCYYCKLCHNLLSCAEMHSCWSFAVVSLLVTCCSVVSGFYVPGVAPRDYTKGENVDIKVQLSLITDYFVYLQRKVVEQN